MRESFGGAFMIKLVLVFIVLYVSIMAVAVQYAKAFRVKNGLINIVEQNKLKPSELESNEKISNYLRKTHYVYGENQGIKDNCSSYEQSILIENSACFVPYCSDIECNNYHYKVITYIGADVKILGIENLVMPVAGETTTIREYILIP